MNYVALHTKGGLIYGVAVCKSVWETERMVRFAKEHNLRITTGELYRPDELIRHAEYNLSTLEKVSD